MLGVDRMMGTNVTVFKKMIKFLFPDLYNFLIIKKIEKRFNASCVDIKKTTIEEYKKKFGVKLDLDNPIAFYEKVNYLKLYQDDYKYSDYVDKVSAKKIARSLSDKIIVPKILYTFDSFEKFKQILKSEKMPSAFVVKLSHTSGDVYFFENGKWRDKKGQKISKRIVFSNLKSMINLNYYHTSFEKCYVNVNRVILIEEYIPSLHGLDEYKFFCNYGKPKMVNVVYGRQDGDKVTEVFTDENLKVLPVNQGLKLTNAEKVYKPKCWDSMMDFAKKASINMPMLRVDILTDGVNFYFCEFTFYDFAGLSIFYPLEWNYTIGRMFELKNRK